MRIFSEPVIRPEPLELPFRAGETQLLHHEQPDLHFDAVLFPMIPKYGDEKFAHPHAVLVIVQYWTLRTEVRFPCHQIQGCFYSVVGFREGDFSTTFGNVVRFGLMGFPYSLGQSECVENFQRRIKLNRHGVTQMFGRNAVRLGATDYRGTTEKPALAYKELQVVANDGAMQLPDGGLE